MLSGITTPIFAGASMDPLKPAAERKNDPGRVEHAARQFESLMISEMMKSIREAEEDETEGEKDQSASAVMQLADEQFAQALAARGGLGLAQIFMKAFPQ